MRTFSLLAIACLAFVGSSRADAKQLRGELQGTPNVVSNCTYEAAEVLKWTPADGPLGSFVATKYEEHSSMVIVLGYDAKGFWTAEADAGSDACDSCSTLNLVRTSFDGKERNTFLLGQGYDIEPVSPEERRKLVKQRLFAVAAKDLDVKALKHDYELTLPKHNDQGRIEKFTGWFAEVKKKDGALLRYALASESFMCWCLSDWRAYTLAAPKKKVGTR